MRRPHLIPFSPVNSHSLSASLAACSVCLSLDTANGLFVVPLLLVESWRNNRLSGLACLERKLQAELDVPWFAGGRNHAETRTFYLIHWRPKVRMDEEIKEFGSEFELE